MTCISAEEFELLSFFEVMPETLDEGQPWPFNDFLYKVDRGDLALSFAIAPAYKDVRVIITSQGKPHYELNAVGVEDVRYHNEKGCETLEIVINRSDTLWLRIKPEIVIKHQAKE